MCQNARAPKHEELLAPAHALGSACVLVAAAMSVMRVRGNRVTMRMQLQILWDICYTIGQAFVHVCGHLIKNATWA